MGHMSHHVYDIKRVCGDWQLVCVVELRMV
jgi:hypothetical protein